jgi:hypothetical protein
MAHGPADPTMTYLLHTSILLTTLLTFSCSGNRKAAKAEATKPVPELVPVVFYGGEGRTDSLFFSFERTPCFGMCPAFRLNVYRSGYATYEGRSHVEREGMHEGRVGMDTLALLLKEAEAIGFFALEDRYDSQVTDLPSLIIRIVSKGRDKKVVARVGYPEKLRNYATFVEELMLPLAWKPIRPQE